MSRWRVPICLSAKHDKMYLESPFQTRLLRAFPRQFCCSSWDRWECPSSCSWARPGPPAPACASGRSGEHCSCRGDSGEIVYLILKHGYSRYIKIFFIIKTNISTIHLIFTTQRANFVFPSGKQKHFLKQKSHSPLPGCSVCKMHWVNVCKLKPISIQMIIIIELTSSQAASSFSFSSVSLDGIFALRCAVWKQMNELT